MGPELLGIRPESLAVHSEPVGREPEEFIRVFGDGIFKGSCGKRDAVTLLSFAITSSIAVMAAQKVFEGLQS